MRNRQIIEYLICPKYFNGHSILYKGIYCVSFRLYNLTKSKTVTPAFPFLIKNEPLFPNEFKQEPVLHADGNFSYLTHKYRPAVTRFQIIYEEERKRIESQCVFRLEYELGKSYSTFLEVKLLRRVSKPRPEQNGLCVRKMFDTKYEVINQQELELKKESFNICERIYFRASQFYSSVDVCMTTFNYGLKVYRSKMQISHLLAPHDLHIHNATVKMREKCESEKRNRKDQLFSNYRKQLMSNIECSLPSYYYELLNMIEEFRRVLKRYEAMRNGIIKERRNMEIPASTAIDLEYIKMKDAKVSLNTLEMHYEVSTPQEIMGLILEEKELVRRNIRKLREDYCLLLTYQTDKQFSEMVQASIEEGEAIEVKLFVKYVPSLVHLEDLTPSLLRIDSIESYTANRPVWNRKISSIPYFFIQGQSQPAGKARPKVTTLTVFVHGYQGNSFDFQKAKNYLRKANKGTHILIIESITNQMNQSIEHLGSQAAEEVIRYIEQSLSTFSYINFVGFSLGGLIARSSFKYLKEYWPKFNFFITFSSPHLGISECDNNLVNLGVWYLIKVDKVKNLKQLNFQSVKFNESLLMQLSNCDGLSQFRKVVLVCSKDDGFVPFYSTVLDQSKCDSADVKALCRNITSKIQQLQRVQMVFDLQGSGPLDKLTGRKGHIQFLDNDYFLQIFFRLYGPSL